MRAAVELVVREEVIGAPQSSLNGPMSGTRHFATVRLDLADVKATKTRLGGTVNDVVLAICAGGLRHLLLSRGDELPEGDLRAQVPVNIRTEDQEHALGNELTSLFVELPVAEADPIARYRRVVERAAQLKAGSQRAGGKTIIDLADMGPPLAGALLARSMFGGTRMFNLTITNVPGPQERLYAFGAPLVEVLPLVPLFAGHTIGIAVVSYAGQVVFGLNADRVAAPDVKVLAEGIERSFAELRPPPAKRPRPGAGWRSRPGRSELAAAGLACADARPDARSHPSHGLVRARRTRRARAEETDFLAAAARLAEVVPGVEAFEVLREVSPKNGFAHGLSMEFADRAAYEAYNEHPEHVAFVQERWLAEVTDFQEIDYEAR